MKRTEMGAHAKAEPQEAVAFYEAQRKGLGREFAVELASDLIQVQTSPQAFRPVGELGTRKHRLRRFPYSVYLRRDRGRDLGGGGGSSQAELGRLVGAPPAVMNGPGTERNSSESVDAE